MNFPEIPPIKFLESVDSTNSYLLNRAGTLTSYWAVATENQTAGRGRLGRSWESPLGSGVAVSIALPLFSRAPSVGIYSLLVGSAILDFVREEGLVNAHVKWPNDVLVGDRKLAGILCEMASSPFVIAGVGVNLFHDNLQLPHLGATSFDQEGKEVGESRGFVVRMVETVRDRWTSAANNRESWSDYLSPKIGTIGQKVKVVESKDNAWEGTAEGIDDEGHLLVRSFRDDVVRTVVAADVLHLRQ